MVCSNLREKETNPNCNSSPVVPVCRHLGRLGTSQRCSSLNRLKMTKQ